MVAEPGLAAETGNLEEDQQQEPLAAVVVVVPADAQTRSDSSRESTVHVHCKPPVLGQEGLELEATVVLAQYEAAAGSVECCWVSCSSCKKEPN
jgi:hypothetical protein